MSSWHVAASHWNKTLLIISSVTKCGSSNCCTMSRYNSLVNVALTKAKYPWTWNIYLKQVSFFFLISHLNIHLFKCNNCGYLLSQYWQNVYKMVQVCKCFQMCFEIQLKNLSWVGILNSLSHAGILRNVVNFRDTEQFCSVQGYWKFCAMMKYWQSWAGQGYWTIWPLQRYWTI